MAQIFHKISFILEIQNAYTGQPVKENDLKVVLENGTEAMQKARGHYIFTNLPYGEYAVHITGKYYQETIMNISYSENGNDMYHVEVMPNAAFFGVRAMTAIVGTACDKKEELISVMIQKETERFRMKKDGKKGDKKVSFIGNNENLEYKKIGSVATSETAEITVLQLGKETAKGYDVKKGLPRDMARANVTWYKIVTMARQRDGSFYLPINMDKLDGITCYLWEGEDWKNYQMLEVKTGNQYQI